MKTWNHDIVTMTGVANISEVTLHCPKHPNQIFRPEKIIAPPKSLYGYDVLAEIGSLRYLEHKQIREIQSQFRTMGIRIPVRTIGQKCIDFLTRIVAVHMESLPKIGVLLNECGGYVLNIDATGTKGSPMLLLLKDGWSGIRLLTASISSEGAEFVEPHLQTLSQALQSPVSAVRDMSKGFENAIKAVFPDLYVITCHYHFLKIIALTLFEPVYPRFSNSVDRRGVKKKLRALYKIVSQRIQPDDDEQLTKELATHILQFKKDGEGLAYPFSLPAVDFYRRCDEVRLRVRDAILDRAKRNVQSPLLSRLEDILSLLNPPPIVLGRLRVQYQSLIERKRWFERVRRALRYRNGPIPLSTEVKLSEKELEKGRHKLDWVREQIRKFDESHRVDKQSCGLRRVLRKVARLLDERRDELFAPNVTVRTGERTVTRRLPRTNTTIERDFRCLRRHGRRIKGNSDVEHMVQLNGVGMLIALNLENKAYVRVVYGSLNRMPERFAQVSDDAIRTAKSLVGILDK